MTIVHFALLVAVCVQLVDADAKSGMSAFVLRPRLIIVRDTKG